MKQPSHTKAEADELHLDDAALERAAEILQRMLGTPPKPHEELKAKKPAKKRAKKPRK